MKRKLTLLVCVVLVMTMVFTFASCNGNKNNADHTHTFSQEWSSDATAHWHESACGHADVKANYSAHVDADNDAKCDICARCDHNLATDWSSDATHHWNASTCNDHKDYKGNLEAHVDANNDAKCDVCKYCSHAYSSDWSSDATGHWHEANCGCIGLDVKDFAAHVDTVLDGVCDICQYVVCAHADENGDGVCDDCQFVLCDHDPEESWTFDAENHWNKTTCEDHPDFKVNVGAHVDANENGLCDTCLYLLDMSKLIASIDQEAETGINSANISTKGESYGEGGYCYTYEEATNTKYYDTYATYTYDGVTYYCSYYGENEAVYVIGVDSDGNATRNESGEYPVGAKATFNAAGLYKYNLESFVVGLYELATAEQEGNNAVVAFVTNYNAETGVASFSYFFYEEYEEYTWDGSSHIVKNAYVVSVEFTLDDETNGITSAIIEVTNYVADDVTFDKEADTYTVAEEASKQTYNKYEATQAFGEALDSTDAPNPYTANVVDDDFTLETRDDEGNVTATYGEDDTIKFTVGDTFVVHFDAETEKLIKFSLVDVSNDGNFSLMCSTAWGDPNKSIEFGSYVAGEYTCTITVEGYVLNLNVVVEYKATTSLGAGVADEWGDVSEAETIDTFVGVENTIGAVVGQYEDPYTTWEVTEGDATKVTVTEDGKKWIVSASEAGEYTIKLTSKNNTELSDTIKLVVAAAPEISGILNGAYEGSNMYSGYDMTVTFNPESEGATSGYITVTIDGEKYDYNAQEYVTISYASTYNYAYDAENGITLTYASGDELAMFEINLVSYKPVALHEGYDYKLAIAEDEEEEETTEVVLGDNTITVTGDNQQMTMVSITATADGKFIFTPGTDAVIEYGSSFAIDGNPLEVEVVTGDVVTVAVNNMYGNAGTVVINVVFEAAESGESNITGEGTEENPYVVTGAGSVLISADYYQPVFVEVKAGVTATLDTGAQFVTMEDGPLGTTVTPTADTTYMVYADAMSGAVVQLTATVSGEGGSTQPTQDGSTDHPYILSATGDYTCEFPGGYDVVWYTYTLTEGGYVTISTTFTGEGWLKLGTNPMTAKENGGTGAALTEYFPAGTVVYLGAGDWDEGADQVPFNVAFEAFASESCADIAGTWTGTESTMFANVAYTLTINADGTGSLVYDEGFGATPATISYILVNGENVVVAFETQYNSGKLVCTYADGTFTCTAGIYSATFTWAKAE